jgi:AraC-like DNA-binding protein
MFVSVLANIYFNIGFFEGLILQYMAILDHTDASLGSLSALLGMSLIWKNRDGGSLAGLAREHRAHMAGYCRAVKSNRADFLRCIHDDTAGCFFLLEKTRAPVIRTCHAGVVDMLVPGFSGEGSLEGCLFAGSCRLAVQGRSVQYKALFRTLPRFHEQSLRIHQPLLRFIADSLASCRAAMRGDSAPDDVEDPAIARAVGYIEQNADKQLAIDDLARICCMSRSGFTRRFRKSRGVSVAVYIQRQRIARAKRLLSTTALEQRAVAQRCGFSSQSYFCTVFRELVGCTPRTYVSRIKRQHEP